MKPEELQKRFPPGFPVNILPEGAKELRIFFRGHQPCAILAKGVTDPVCGMCQKTKERTGTKSSHVDWWLYADARPHIYFEEVQTEVVNQDVNS